MKVVAVVSLVAVLLLTTGTSAGIRPSFSLDHCTWHATNIVLATEGEKIDGRLTVLESLKGDLSSGEVVSIAELASFKPASEREVKSGYFGEKSHEPKKYVTGSRMMLFLKKKDRTPEALTSVTDNPRPSDNWEPASIDGINWSVLWIEGDQPFAFVQVMNPGPTVLVPYAPTEKDIRDKVIGLMQLQEALHAAVATKDELLRAEALAPLAVSDSYLVRDPAFTEMRKCGVAALPVLRKMLGDQTLLKLHAEVLRSLASAGGDEFADELTAIVKEELAFWKETGPQLRQGWWNHMRKPETEDLRSRYSKVLEALYSLKKLKPIGCKEIVTEFRDFWRSLPQLDDKSGLNQMSEACDNLLRELPQQ